MEALFIHYFWWVFVIKQCTDYYFKWDWICRTHLSYIFQTLHYCVEFPLSFWLQQYEVARHLCDSFVLYCSNSLIQQTRCDLVTPGCQGESGGVMAVEGTVGESQLQRIIRDLHGTLPLCVCMCDWLRTFLKLFCPNVTQRRRIIWWPLGYYHIIVHLELPASSYSPNQFGTWAFESFL